MLWMDVLGRGFAPWREFSRLESELDRMLSGLGSPRVSEFPAVNVWSDSERAVVTTEIPGIDPQSIEISVTGKTVTIRGERMPEQLAEGEVFHRRERWYGQFSKALEMPFPVEAGKVEAKFRRGVLAVALPRAEADKPRKITVTAN